MGCLMPKSAMGFRTDSDAVGDCVDRRNRCLACGSGKSPWLRLGKDRAEVAEPMPPSDGKADAAGRGRDESPDALDVLICDTARTRSISKLAALRFASDRSKLYSLLSASTSITSDDRGNGGNGSVVSFWS